MSSPTREELGLPWTVDKNSWFLKSNPDHPVLSLPQTRFDALSFALYAANTYHEREALLKECLGLLEFAYVKDATLQARLREALKEPK